MKSPLTVTDVREIRLNEAIGAALWDKLWRVPLNETSIIELLTSSLQPNWNTANR